MVTQLPGATDMAKFNFTRKRPQSQLLDRIGVWIATDAVGARFYGDTCEQADERRDRYGRAPFRADSVPHNRTSLLELENWCHSEIAQALTVDYRVHWQQELKACSEALAAI